MIDAHVHIFRENSGEYSVELIDSFVRQAQKNGIIEIYMLEHTHQFHEFKQMYKPIIDNNVRILTASDAHRPEHAGANIKEMQRILDS